MGQLLVSDLDNHLLLLLKERAARHGRSVEAENRAILEAALLSFAERAARLRAHMPPSTVDSTDLIRADRDSNYYHFPENR